MSATATKWHSHPLFVGFMQVSVFSLILTVGNQYVQDNIAKWKELQAKRHELLKSAISYRTEIHSILDTIDHYACGRMKKKFSKDAAALREAEILKAIANNEGLGRTIALDMRLYLDDNAPLEEFNRLRIGRDRILAEILDSPTRLALEQAECNQETLDATKNYKKQLDEGTLKATAPIAKSLKFYFH